MSEYVVRPSVNEPLVVIPSGVFVEAVRYEVSCLPADDVNRRSFTVTVELERGGWAVKEHGERRDTEGRPQRDPPSDVDRAEWWKKYHFNLPTALALALALAPKVICNGHTVTDALKFREENQGG